ncbi:MAG: hypothetical protein ABI197_00855 [Granulicella sp.]
MTTEPFDWTELSKLADELAKRPEESCRRTAVGRAYYFVFHLARKRIIDNGYRIVPGGNSHKQVWDKYTDSPELDCRKLGEIAKRLKEKRERADYSDAYPRLEDDLPQILASAQEFASQLASLNPRLPANTAWHR